MSLGYAPDGTGVVICDRCSVSYYSDETSLVLAYGNATLNHGWKSHKAVPGVVCPDCHEAIQEATA